MIDVLLKRIAQAGTPFAASLLSAFALAFVLLLGVQRWRHLREHQALAWRNLGAGMRLGTLNFGNILFYMRAHQALPDGPAAVLAAMNLGVIGLDALLGMPAFGRADPRLEPRRVAAGAAGDRADRPRRPRRAPDRRRFCRG